MIPNHVVKCTNIMKSLNLSELQNIGVALGVAASSKIALIGQLHPQFALQFSGCVVHRLHKVEERLPLALVELGHQDRRASPRKSRSPRATARPWFLASCSPPNGCRTSLRPPALDGNHPETVRGESCPEPSWETGQPCKPLSEFAKPSKRHSV